jgi:hypothetical protein
MNTDVAAAASALTVPEVQKFFDVIVNPIIQLIFAAAILYFVYGVFTYIRKSDESTSRVDGANHILWSTVGLFIMISVWGIINLIERTFGVS